MTDRFGHGPLSEELGLLDLSGDGVRISLIKFCNNNIYDVYLNFIHNYMSLKSFMWYISVKCLFSVVYVMIPFQEVSDVEGDDHDDDVVVSVYFDDKGKVSSNFSYQQDNIQALLEVASEDSVSNDVAQPSGLVTI